jgi:hypothetical protein
MKKNLFLILSLIFLNISCFFLPLGFITPELPAGMPAEVYFRTNATTFNDRYLFVLDSGHLWLKQKASPYGPATDWMCLGTFEHPYKSIMSDYFISKVDSVSVDGAYMIILVNGRIIQSSDGYKSIDKIVWTDRYGYPFSAGMGMTMPEDFSTWSASLNDPNFQEYYTDGNGIKFNVFVGHIYGLSSNGTDIRFMDGWFHRDSEYQAGGPLRDRFIMRSMSVSGSVLFVMNDQGDMFVSHQDFDVLGANPILKYTYDTVTPADPAKVYDLEYPRKLPYVQWDQLPKITGDITSKITIFSTGKGALARTLRVEGRSAGLYGYFEKPLSPLSDPWVFHATGVTCSGFISNPASDTSALTAIPVSSVEFSYSGSSKGLGINVSAFNFYSSPATIVFQNASGGSSTWTLQHHISYRNRPMENVGSVNEPLLLKGVLEVPADLSTLGDLLPYYQTYLKAKKPEDSGRFIPVTMEVSDQKLTLFSTLFLNSPIELHRN